MSTQMMRWTLLLCDLMLWLLRLRLLKRHPH
jgi:hypothetical protein